MSQEIVPWEIWWTNFDPQVSGEQAGLRPAIVVGTTFACQLPNQLVFVVPCTTTDRLLPFHPLVKSPGRPSFAICDQVKSISRKRLTRRLPARLDPKEITTIKFVLRQMIDTR